MRSNAVCGMFAFGVRKRCWTACFGTMSGEAGVSGKVETLMWGRESESEREGIGGWRKGNAQRSTFNAERSRGGRADRAVRSWVAFAAASWAALR